MSNETAAPLACARRRRPSPGVTLNATSACAVGGGTATPLTVGASSMKKAAAQPAPLDERTPSDETVKLGAARMGPAWNEKLTPSMLNTLYLEIIATTVV